MCCLLAIGEHRAPRNRRSRAPHLSAFQRRAPQRRTVVGRRIAPGIGSLRLASLRRVVVELRSRYAGQKKVVAARVSAIDAHGAPLSADKYFRPSIRFNKRQFELADDENVY